MLTVRCRLTCNQIPSFLNIFLFWRHLSLLWVQCLLWSHCWVHSWPTMLQSVNTHQPMVACNVIDCAVGHQIAFSYDVVSWCIKHLSRRCYICNEVDLEFTHDLLIGQEGLSVCWWLSTSDQSTSVSPACSQTLNGCSPPALGNAWSSCFEWSLPVWSTIKFHSIHLSPHRQSIINSKRL